VPKQTSQPAEVLLMALPRLAVSGGANGARLIFLLCLIPLFFLGVLLSHPLISLSPRFFEVVGVVLRGDGLLEQAAAQNRRSMNAEIINRLEASFSAKKSNARLVAEAFLGLHHGDELADELGRITDELKGRDREVYEDYAYDEYSDELNRRREEEAEPAKQDKENEPK
jgi:Arc-like DNA binding domain